MAKTFPDDDQHFLRSFAVQYPDFVTETGIATIWRVTQDDGSAAALKIYADGNMQGEAPGFDLLRAQDGRGAARVLGLADGAALLEWLDGPSLGDLTRAGQDDLASEGLIDTVKRLHQMPTCAMTTLSRLEDRFAALMNARYTTACPHAAQNGLRAATALAQRLLAAQKDQRPLHGDFHHDNVLGSPRGYLAIDAKGVFGDRLYELANAFRNPLGAEDQVLTTPAIARRADHWANGFDTKPNDLLTWAVAHTALSLAWTYNGVFEADVMSEIAYLDRLLALTDTSVF